MRQQKCSVAHNGSIDLFGNFLPRIIEWIPVQPLATSTPGITIVPSAASPADKTTYIDPFCYAFDYPKTWNLSGTGGQTMTLMNFVVGGGRDGLEEGQVKLSFTPVMASSLEQFAKGSNSQGPDYSTLPVITLPGGLQAIRTSGQDNVGDTFQMLLTYFNGTGLGVTGYADPATFDSIVNTLRLMEDC
jgi:hypothetical protein